VALLEEASMAEMVDFIGQALKEDEAVDDEQPAAEIEVQTQSSEASEDVNEEEASPSETVEDVKEEAEEEPEEEVVVAQEEPEEKQQKDSKWVPRDRLNDVNDKWRQRESQLLLQIGALEERTRQPQPSNESGDADWLDNFVEEGAADNPDIEQLKATQVKVLQWQEEFTRQMIYKEFNTELQAAMTKYPDIPEEAFRNAVVRDGSVNMLQLGDQLSGERNKMMAAWKADWESTNGTKAPEAEVEAETAAVRRPSRRTAAPPAPKAQPETYSTVREAGDAMAKEMAAFFENLQD
jgi:hypothetical protein